MKRSFDFLHQSSSERVLELENRILNIEKKLLRKMHRRELEKSQTERNLNMKSSNISSSSTSSILKPTSIQSNVPDISTGGLTSNYNQRVTEKARAVRGETSRRIQNLMDDWRDYKETADDEIRRRMRAEQILHDAVAQKQKELNQQEYELNSLRSLSYEQKQIITQLKSQAEEDAKVKAHCAQLEMQLNKCKEQLAAMQTEVRHRNDAITSLQLERESLLQLNGVLKVTNQEQKSRIETSEKEVSETRHELEVIEDMIRQLYEKKVFPLRASPTNSRSTTPVAGNSAFKRTSTPKKRGVVIEAVPPTASAVGHADLNVVSSVAASFGDSTESGTASTQSSSSNLDSNNTMDQSKDRTIGQRPSAMTALRSLQQSHNEQCSHLAEHIETLKQNSRLRESQLSRASGSGANKQ